MSSLSTRRLLPWLASFCVALHVPFVQAASSASFELEGSIDYAKDSNKYLLVYSSNEVDDGPNIYGRLLDVDGSPADKDFRLSTQTGKMTKPVLSYGTSASRFLVLWGRKAGDGAQIIASSVGLDGKVVGKEFQVSQSTLYDQRPAVAYCPGRDRFLVTWTRGTQYNFDKGVSDIWGQFISGDGTQMQGNNFLIASAVKNQFKSDVDCDTVNDRFLVVWEDQRNAGTQDDIYGQLINSDGNMPNGNFVVSAMPSVERRPVVAANQDGSHLVVWESDTKGSADLYSQMIDPNGKMLGEPVQIGSDLAGGRDRPDVAYLKKQEVFLVVFHNSKIGAVSDGIYGQFVEKSGKLRETTFPVTTANKGQYRPHVRAADNTFLTIWTDYRDTADKQAKHHVYEYYGRVIGNDMALSSRWRNPDSR